MQRSVELSLHLLRECVLKFINMHKVHCENPGELAEGFFFLFFIIKPCFKFLELVKDNVVVFFFLLCTRKLV